MLRTARRTNSRYDAISKLNAEEFTSGKIVPSRVRTLFSVPITVLPALDAPTIALNAAAGLGLFMGSMRFYLWKPAGSAYVGTPGNLRLTTSTGANTLNTPFTTELTSTNAWVVNVVVGGNLLPATGTDRFTLS